MSAVPKGTVGRTRKQRQIQAIDRPLQSRPAFNAAKASQRQAIATRNAPKPAATRSASARTPRGPMSQRQQESLQSAKGDLQTSRSRLKAARERKAKASGPLEKLQAQSRIDEHSLNAKRAERRITAIQARPQFGAPATGAGRASERMSSAAPRRPGAIRGSVKRNPQAASMIRSGVNLSAGKYKNIYIANTNKAAARARTGTISKPKGPKPGASLRKTQPGAARMQRAQSRFNATADTRNQPGSKMIRRPDAKTSRGNRRAEQAVKIYKGASFLEISNYGKGVARTSRAKNNYLQTRSARVEQAQRSGLPLVTVTGSKSRAAATRRRKRK